MSFYSLVVRDPKRGWIVASDGDDLDTTLDTCDHVNSTPDFKAMVLSTDGNSRNVNAGLEFIKQVKGKGLSKVMSFRRLDTVHTL